MFATLTITTLMLVYWHASVVVIAIFLLSAITSPAFIALNEFTLIFVLRWKQEHNDFLKENAQAPLIQQNLLVETNQLISTAQLSPNPDGYSQLNKQSAASDQTVERHIAPFEITTETLQTANTTDTSNNENTQYKPPQQPTGDNNIPFFKTITTTKNQKYLGNIHDTEDSNNNNVAINDNITNSLL